MEITKSSLCFITFFLLTQANEHGGNQRSTDQRLSEVEKKVADSNERYSDLEERLAAYAEVNKEVLAALKDQREELRKKDAAIELLTKHVYDLQEKLDNKLTVGPVDNAPPKVENDTGPEVVNRPARFVMDQGEAVAFHVVVNKNGEAHHLGVNQPIIFDTVLLNINNGYNKLHGNFVAPTAGLYMFSTSVLDAGSQPLIHADLVKNGNVLARAYGHGNGGYPEQGSVTVVTQLNAGDDVYVRISCCGDISITGMSYTSFTGALLMYL